MTACRDPMPGVSVIVPAFNAAAFIGRCLDSLEAQTFRDFEVIVVDDGSTDGTGALVGSRPESNLRLLSKPNGGTGSAKNLGLSHATGEFVMFLDSDDWLESDCLAAMHAAARAGNLDIVASDVYLDYPGRAPCYTRSSPPAAAWGSPHDVLADVLTMRNVSWMASRLYRRALFEEHRLRYDETIHLSEDRVLDLKLFFHARRVGKLDKAFLHYVQRPESLSNRRDRDYLGDVAAHGQIVRFLDEAGLRDRYRQELEYLEFRTVFLSLVLCPNIDQHHYEAFARIRANLDRYRKNPLVQAYYRNSVGLPTRVYANAYRVSYRLGRGIRRFIVRLRSLSPESNMPPHGRAP